jgi:ADP-heptose:LPS heptosyltransferase
MKKMRELVAKAGRYAWWRGYAPWAHPMANRLAARWGLAARTVRWPLSLMAPYRRDELHVVRRWGLGDVLLSTPALREVKRRNPGCRITLYTDFPELVEGLPFLDRVTADDDPTGGALWLNYEWSLPPRRHLARIVGDLLGVEVRDVRPSCAVRPELVERFRLEWSGLPRPIVIVARRASNFTPNKEWPDPYWDDLVARLAARGTVVDVGGPPSDPPARPAGSYIDLRGMTSLPELIAAVAAADLHVAPVTGTVHIAAAMGVPSVVIYGGYEPPVCTAYPGNIGLGSAVECAPCWLREPCPYGKKCLHQITPDQVEAALDRLWAAGPRPTRAGGRRDAAGDGVPAGAGAGADGPSPR